MRGVRNSEMGVFLGGGELTGQGGEGPHALWHFTFLSTALLFSTGGESRAGDPYLSLSRARYLFVSQTCIPKKIEMLIYINASETPFPPLDVWFLLYRPPQGA